MVESKATANTAEGINEDVGACALVMEDKDKVTDKPEECGECIEKDIQWKYWEAKYKDLLKLYENRSRHDDCVEKDNQWETKYKDLKKVYMNQSHHYSELNIKYNVLLQTKSNYCQPDDDATNACYDDVFSSKELKILQNMSLDKKKDSTFIHQCLEYAYKNDLAVLSGRTLKGKAESVKFSDEGQEEYIPKKDPLSPEKVDRIKELFIERIIKCNVDSACFEARIKDSNINKLFASSIKNIANKN